MDFDGEWSAKASTGDRRSFLSALDDAVREHGGMACGMVPRSGTPVLFVINSQSPSRSAEISADFIEGRWLFTWARTNKPIGPADAPTGSAEVIARAVRVASQGSPR